MVVYWDLAALWNFVLDYILLLGTLSLAGLPVRRRRLVLAAAFGAAYSVAEFALPLRAWTIFGAMLVMCALAFGRTRFLKLTLLFTLLACGLGGAVLLLGRCFGAAERIVRGVIYAQIPWGVFFAAAGFSYLLLTVAFRGSAQHDRSELIRVRIEYAGRSVTLNLLRDTGNLLTDPLTGEGVPVIEKSALEALLLKKSGSGEENRSIAPLCCRTVGAAETVLDAFRCDALVVNGRNLGARLIAISREPFGGRYQGLWFDDHGAVAEQTESIAVLSTVSR